MTENKITMDSVTEGENLPNVSEHAIGALKQKLEGEEQKQIELENEQPKKKTRGRPKKINGDEKPKLNIPSDKNTTTENKNNISSEYAAKVVSGTIEKLSCVILSPEWELSEIERNSNVSAWTAAIDSSGGLNLTPWQALALDYTGIIITKTTQSKVTRSKLSLAWSWFKIKIKGGKDALFNNRKDTKRKDDMGEKEGSEPKEDNGQV